MAKITLEGNPINTIGKLPALGTVAPDFTLTKTDMSDIKLSDLKGQKVVLNIFVSLDTSICADSVKVFNEKATQLNNVKVLCISRDLPFAHGRFCESNGIKNVENLSELRNIEFGKNYGTTIIDGPLAGLLARSIVILDEEGKVIYTELVPEIVQDPDYEKAMAALQ